MLSEHSNQYNTKLQYWVWHKSNYVTHSTQRDEWHIPKCHTFEPKKVVTVFGFYKLHFKQLYYKSTTDVLTCSDFVVSVFTNIHFLKTIFTVAVSFVGKYTVAHFWLMETGIILTHSSIILSLLFGCLHVFALALWKVLCFILKSDNPLGCLEKKTHPFRVLLIIICLWGQKFSLCLMSIWVIHLLPFFWKAAYYHM